MIESLAAITAALDESEDFVLVAHQDADADSLGSALAFAEYLDRRGKRVAVLAPKPVPQGLSYLPGFRRVNQEDITAGSTVIAFDAGSPSRFGDLGQRIATAPLTILFDHHISNDGFGDLGVVDRQAAATGMVVLSLLRRWGAEITPDMATNLYAAIFTDTGGFRHDNTSGPVLHAAAELVDLGADPAFVALRSYKWRPATTLRLQALAASAAHYELGGRLIWTAVTQQMLQEAGAALEETEGIIDLLQTLDTMRCALLFKEAGEGLTKVSLRTRGRLAAHELVADLGGGGHFRAAGAELRSGLLEAEEAVLRRARAAVLDEGEG
ncbi:MAG: bifunctional oligoribonuclease/PAP phosphatase NrnA [Candidatus Dormibacteraeota bacterium]|nr:bifunctional oligoribonuclease/PAP phosphatase NrnA [Candidatus Dormibacteraeota bacterium]